MRGGTGLRAGTLILLTLGTACIPTQKPQFTKRFASASYDQDNLPRVTISVFTTASPSSNALSDLKSLSDRGQGALIEAFADKSKNTSEFLSSFSNRLGTGQSSPVSRDLTIFRRRLIYSVEHTADFDSLSRPTSTADRISWLKLTSRVNTDQVRFKGWDRYTTRYESVDIGKLTAEQKASSAFEIGLALPKVAEVGDIGIKSGMERSLNEEVQLRQRYVASSGTIADGEASLIQEGVVGIDLTGNVIVDYVFDLADDPEELEVVHFSKLFDSSGKVNPPNLVLLQHQYLKVPTTARDVFLDTHARYVILHVREGEATVNEGDDAVEFLQGTTSSNRTLVLAATDQQISSWHLVDRSGNRLHIGRSHAERVVRFASYDQATQFFTWMQTSSWKSGRVSVAGHQLYLDPLTPLESQKIEELSIAIRRVNW